MSQTRALSDFLTNLPLRGLAALTRPLPERARAAVGAAALRVILHRIPRFRKRVDENLARIFPDMPRSERDAIRARLAVHLGRTAVEILHPGALLARASHFTWEGEAGLETLLQAEANGTGAVSVSGHFGQWEACRAFMKARGIEVGAIYRPLKNRYSERDLTRRYSAFGTPLFPKSKRGTLRLVRHLQEGNLIAILADQKIDEGLLTDFLGQPAATAPLAAELALSRGVPLVAAYATRGPDPFSIHISFEDPIPHTDAATMTQAINDSLAARVRAHPDQYYWLHRRWQIRNPEHLRELDTRRAASLGE